MVETNLMTFARKEGMSGFSNITTRSNFCLLVWYSCGVRERSIATKGLRWTEMEERELRRPRSWT